MLLLYLSVLFISAIADQVGHPSVRTPFGLVRGSWKTSTNGRVYASFRGVPYAAPPIGDLRFEAPQPPASWEGEWDATKFSSKCMQYDGWAKAFAGDEDCLYLNVYSPNLNPEKPLPTMIYIHGGAFLYGTGAIYGPGNLMDWDMVVVTMNYRLGALGFLSTGDTVIPGNNGLKDQSRALHWVKDNIRAFGGDPESITLTGNSAGAASVHYHYLSPLSRGTFDRGIAFSGSAFAPWTHATKPKRYAKRLSALLDCPLASQEMLECLKNTPADHIVRAQAEMYDWVIHMFTPFTPTKEPVHNGSFLSRYPYEASQSGDIYQVPLIASVTSEEGLYPAGMYMNQKYSGILDEIETNWEHLASNIFEYNDTLPSYLRGPVAEAIKRRYLHSKPVSRETFPQLVQALGDRLFSADVGRLVQEHALRTSQPTYLYRYSFRGHASLSNLMTEDDANYGTCHSDDLIHVFQGSINMNHTDDRSMTKSLINVIFNYATTGVPKIPNSNWEPVTPGSSCIEFLEISSPTSFRMRSSTDFGNKTFWDSLGFIENENHNNLVRG